MSNHEFVRLINASFDALFVLGLDAPIEKRKQTGILLSTLSSIAQSFPEAKVEVLYVLKTLIEDFPGRQYDSLLSQLPDIDLDSADTVLPPNNPLTIRIARHDLVNVVGMNAEERHQKPKVSGVADCVDVIAALYDPAFNFSLRNRAAQLNLVQTVAGQYDKFLSTTPVDPRVSGLWEIRSLVHELLDIPPVIEEVYLPDMLKEFLAANQFRNKRPPSLPVIPYLKNPTGSVPSVLIDAGDFFRSMRNLLKDVAGHGIVVGDEIPVYIEISIEHSIVFLTIRNHGQLSPWQLSIIGLTPYSESGEEQHGFGKVSVSQLFTRNFRAIDVEENVIQHAIREQWRNDYIGSKPAVRWQMPMVAA